MNALNLQDRDLSLLRGLFECRIMTAEHVARLYFDLSREAAKKRIQKLKSYGVVGTRARRVNEPAILFLTRTGLNTLRDHGVLAEYPALGVPALERRAKVSDLTIRHELEVMDVKTACHTAIKTTKAFSIVEFSTWPLLYEFEAVRPGHSQAEILVKPDGFIRIHEKEPGGGLFEHTFFLEVDRSTETLNMLVSRAGCYLNFYKSGGFAVKNGAPRSAYRDFPFRVLMVFKTVERRNNTAARLLQSNPPIFTQVYLSTLDEVTHDPLGTVWICPADYREATKGTPFDSEHRVERYGYQRQTARELFVEQKTRRRRLLVE